MKAKLLFLILVCFLTISAQCSGCNGDKPGTTGTGTGTGTGGGTTPAGCIDTNLAVPLASESMSGTDLICNYGPTHIDGSGCVQARTTVSGTGTTPSAVNVARTNSSANGSGALLAPTAGWSATGNRLNCAILDCPTGDYSATLTFANGQPGTCPASITFVLDFN